MPYIKVTNPENNCTWKQQLSIENFQKIKGNLKGRGTVAILPAALIPVRTNNLENFAKDFFLPTTINHAIKVNNTVLKIFAILVSLVLDTITFPIRLLTCIPRIISNAAHKKDPLLKYLIGQGVGKNVLASSHILVKISWEETSIFPTIMETDENGNSHATYGKEKRWQETTYNFIEVPTYKEENHSAFSVHQKPKVETRAV